MNTRTRTDYEREFAPWELNVLISWFMYRIPSADRRQLMRDLPSIYNRLVGREIVTVEHRDE
jgi:hypothetical protein